MKYVGLVCGAKNYTTNRLKLNLDNNSGTQIFEIKSRILFNHHQNFM